MTYMDQLHSALRALIAAGEAGRRSADEMLEPLTGAISDISEAAAALEDIPYVGPLIGARLQRTMRAINRAQKGVAKVLDRYSHAVAKVALVKERVALFEEKVAKAAVAINRVAGRISPALANLLPTASFAPAATPPAEVVKPFPHLLILQSLQAQAQPYYFNLDTATFDELRRQTRFRWAGQERLTRSPAQQAVGLGEERITLKGTIFPGAKSGLGQLQALRSIGRQLQPLSLTSGYGEVLGNWCLTSIEEDQSNLLAGGIPRKQGFSLEFISYGDDLQNV
ncbi:phage tail protein [Pseudomonas sp. MAFF212428]|uniref:Phage tail protein n=1 Tax=Pseudomonas brassicae TaxID=2708063 RepID=A0A6B3NIZ6_9PSED|nr:phage tail protein [Pseudomonas brassicae]NER58906.1 phage tail protein [Pseudomonas brassicae]NER63195.1 phage tail protein [Pseudomonas brassicae]